MDERFRLLGLDNSKFAAPVESAVITAHLTPGQFDISRARTHRQVIMQGIPEEASWMDEDTRADVQTFFFNGAGVHAALWRRDRPSNLFITGKPRASREVDISAESARTGEDEWLVLSKLLSQMFDWSLRTEVERLIRLGRSDDTNPAESVVRFIEKTAAQIEKTQTTVLKWLVYDELKETSKAAASTMSAFYKMCGVLVEENGVPSENIPVLSEEILENSYRINGLLTVVDFYTTQFAPREIFHPILTGDADEYAHYFQLEEAQDGSIFMNFSQAFIDYVAGKPKAPGGTKRVGCPAGRFVSNKLLLPKEWEGLRLESFVRNMWEVGAQTAKVIYQRQYAPTG